MAVEQVSISKSYSEMDIFGCEPWLPVPVEPKNPKEPTFIKDTSDHYIARLEAKLARIKGNNREATAKDLLKALDKLREGQMETLVSTPEPVPAVTAESDEDIPSEDVQGSSIQKKLHPERVALTQEEKELLMEHDFLGKMYNGFEDKKVPLIMGWIPYDYDKEDSTVQTEDEEDSTGEKPEKPTRSCPPAQSASANTTGNARGPRQLKREFSA